METRRTIDFEVEKRPNKSDIISLILIWQVWHHFVDSDWAQARSDNKFSTDDT